MRAGQPTLRARAAVDVPGPSGYARQMKSVLAAALVTLAAAATASAELVARGVPNGLLAVSPIGRPLVAYLDGRKLIVARRVATGEWRRETAAVLAKHSSLAAFAASTPGPVAVIVGPGQRTLFVVRRKGDRWSKTFLVRRLDAGVFLGWPGLALERGGRPVVAYTRWRERNRLSQLVLARVTGAGAVRAWKITTNGWPASYVAPPAAPVVLPNGDIHVVETYGISGTVGTIEWMPTRKSWTGQFISGGVGDFPVGPMFAGLGPGNVIYSAWTEAFLGWGEFPVTLASHGRSVDASFVLNRALTTALAVTPRGPEVAANQWVSASDVGLPSDEVLWAGTITGRGGGELDGWIDGLVGAPTRPFQDLLLAGPGGLSWFRARGALPVRVTLTAELQNDGSVALAGRVRGAGSGRVTVYRERPGYARETAGTPKLGAGGAFALVDSPRARPVLYRAVYTDPATGIPYAKLLRAPVG